MYDSDHFYFALSRHLRFEHRNYDILNNVIYVFNTTKSPDATDLGEMPTLDALDIINNLASEGFEMGEEFNSAIILALMTIAFFPNQADEYIKANRKYRPEWSKKLKKANSILKQIPIERDNSFTMYLDNGIGQEPAQIHVSNGANRYSLEGLCDVLLDYNITTLYPIIAYICRFEEANNKKT